MSASQSLYQLSHGQVFFRKQKATLERKLSGQAGYMQAYIPKQSNLETLIFLAKPQILHTVYTRI